MAVIKKLIKPLICIAAVTLLGVGMVNLLKISKEKKHGKLLSYSYSYGGDMLGSHESTKIKRTEDGRALVYLSSAKQHNYDANVSEYYVTRDVLDKIEEVVDRYKMYKYNRLSDSKMFAYDAGSSSYTFRFENLSVSFGSSKNVPSNGWDAIREISKIISEYVAEGEKLPGLVTEHNSDENYYAREVKAGSAYIEVYEYSENVLYYRIKNGLEEDITVENNNTLYLINGEERVEICHSEGSYARNVPVRYCDDESMVIKGERLSAGRYVLVAGGYEVEFEIK